MASRVSSGRSGAAGLPFSLEAAKAVKAWGPDEVVLLPLYPQYATTTTGSSLPSVMSRYGPIAAIPLR